MTATTSGIGTQTQRETFARIRRLALAVGAFLGAIGSRWSDFVDAGQLGSDPEATISRHTGARI